MRATLYIKIALMCFLLSLMPSVVSCSEAVEGVFSFKYVNFEKDMIVYIQEDAVYFPIFEIFDFLRIYKEYDPSSKILSGYVSSEERSYSIDFTTYEATNLQGDSYQIEKDSIIINELDMYITASEFSKILDVEIFVSKLGLIGLLKSTYEMPLLEEYNLRYNKLKLKGLASEEVFAPLMYGRDFKIIDGGVVNYGINSNTNKQSTVIGLNTNLGMQLLGGELAINNSYIYNTYSQTKFQNIRYNWQFPFNKNKYLNSLRVGYVTGNSLNFGSSGSNIRNKYSNLQGISISNREMDNRKVFDEFQFEDITEPYSLIEIYVNSRLVKQFRCEEDGRYRFALPLTYGNSIIETKIYSPSGQRDYKKETVNIPGMMLQPGQVRYTLTSGKDINYEEYIVDGIVETGVTDWLSTSVSNVYNIDNKVNLLVSNSTVRLMGGAYSSFAYSHDNFYRTMIAYANSQIGHYELSYMKYKSDSEVDKYGKEAEYQLNVNLPRIPYLPFSLRLRADVDQYSNRLTGNYSVNTYGNIGSIRINNSYRLAQTIMKDLDNSYNHYINCGVSYYLQLPFLKDSRALGRTSISTNFNYDLNIGQFTNLSASISQSLFRILSISANYRNNLVSNYSSFNINLSLNMDFARFSSRAELSESNQSINNNLDGSLGFDTDRFNVFPSKRLSYTGNSGLATIKCFIDSNGNLSYDDGEEVLTGVPIRVPRASVLGDRDDEYKTVSNLRPGYQYNVIINNSGLKNPLLRPLWDDFSFIADPNTFKSIDIPFTVTGLIEGQVFTQDSSGNRNGKSGVKLHIISKKTGKDVTVNVFSDGSFYHLGLFPGYYDVYVDKTQLGLLNMITDPPSQEIYIGFSEDGDMKSGIDFRLLPNKDSGGVVSPSAD